MSDKSRSWDFQALTPTPQLLPNSEDFQRASPFSESIMGLGVCRQSLEVEILTCRQPTTIWVELPAMITFKTGMQIPK